MSFATLKLFQYCALDPIDSNRHKTLEQFCNGINLFFIVLRGYILWTMTRNCHLEGVQKWNKGSRRVFRSKLLKSYIPWNVLLSHLNGERTMSERWANGEWTMNARWTNAKQTQCERCLNAECKLVNDMWTLNDERTRNANGAQMRAQCERWTHDERTMNARWTHDERFIRKVSGIFIALYLTSNLVGIYMYEFLNFVILYKRIYFLYKRTIWNRNYLYMSRRDLYTQNKLIIKDNSWLYHPAL